MNKLYNSFNERAKRLNSIDIKLIQIGTFFLAIIAVIIFPEILKINIIILIILAFSAFLIPAYKFLIKK